MIEAARDLPALLVELAPLGYRPFRYLPATNTLVPYDGKSIVNVLLTADASPG